jgi:hypothetical protein
MAYGVAGRRWVAGGLSGDFAIRADWPRDNRGEDMQPGDPGWVETGHEAGWTKLLGE